MTAARRAGDGRVEKRAHLLYMSGMADNTSTPFTIEISPITKPAGQFQWAIRRNGKLIERSDRPHPTEAKAEASALAAVERSMHSASSGRW